jgi:FemAB-related protein (PEP-CTERM system-associated)
MSGPVPPGPTGLLYRGFSKLNDIKMTQILKVREFMPEDAGSWNRFVRTCPHGTFFHRAEWRQIFESSLGHKAHYLIAEVGDEIRGVLPLVHIRSRIFSNLLASLPFLAYGGVLASDTAAVKLLQAAAESLGEQLGVDFIEFRDRDEARTDWPCKDNYVTFRKEIPDNSDDCLKMIPRKQRAMVRKGISHGLEPRIESNLDNFFAIFSESYRNLGTPVLSKKYFEAIKETFGSDCEVLTIFKDGAAVASVMSYFYEDEVIPYYGGSLPTARKLMANDFMYWELMRRAAESGIRIFDYGRSREGTGSYRFKKHWGFVPEPLYYQYKLVGQTAMADLSPGNPKYRLAIAAWKKMPLWATRLLGPYLARGLPG